MRIGYARVSTQDQHPALQLDALTAAGCEPLFTEQMSGANAGSGLEEALAVRRSGDVLVVWKRDRLGHGIGPLFQLIEALNARGLGFKSLRNAIDTTTPEGLFLYRIRSSCAELERDLARARTMVGVLAARARGRKGGRRPGSPRIRRNLRRKCAMTRRTGCTTSSRCFTSHTRHSTAPHSPSESAHPDRSPPMPRDLPEAWLDIPSPVCLDLAHERPPAARRPGCSHTRSRPAIPPLEEEA